MKQAAGASGERARCCRLLLLPHGLTAVGVAAAAGAGVGAGAAADSGTRSSSGECANQQTLRLQAWPSVHITVQNLVGCSQVSNTCSSAQPSSRRGGSGHAAVESAQRACAAQQRRQQRDQHTPTPARSKLTPCASGHASPLGQAPFCRQQDTHSTMSHQQQAGCIICAPSGHTRLLNSLIEASIHRHTPGCAGLTCMKSGHGSAA
jgi:hypothetical protein